MLARTKCAGIARRFIAPGKPQQTGLCEAVDTRMGDGPLDETPSVGLDAARRHLARWGGGDKHRRPHSAIGSRRVAADAARLTETGGAERRRSANPATGMSSGSRT